MPVAGAKLADMFASTQVAWSTRPEARPANELFEKTAVTPALV